MQQLIISCVNEMQNFLVKNPVVRIEIYMLSTVKEKSSLVLCCHPWIDYFMKPSSNFWSLGDRS